MSRFLLFVSLSFLSIIISCSPYARNLSDLKSSDVEKRRNAAFALSRVERLDGKYIKNLFEAMDDPDPLVREFVVKTAGKMDPRIEGVPQIIKMGLRDKDISVRRAAAAIFSTMNPVPTEILVALAENINDKDTLLSSFVKTVFVDLGEIGVTSLINICKSTNVEVKCNAISMLGEIGCEAKRALPTLQGYLNDENEKIRTTAQQSIEKIQSSYFCPPSTQKSRR
ncbi:MAG: HEAT repeat domain-containing protein [Chitinispirillaceae bacterium]|nr:HEAT repeat domain-containing protein [Chitinispirillaceae bacterium]